MKFSHKSLSFFTFLIPIVLFAQENKNLLSQNINNLKNNKSLNVGGRIMFDNAFFKESDLLNKSFDTEQSTSGNQFRRLFLYASGELQTNIEYKLQVNLIDGQVGLRDAFIGFKNIPLIGSVRFGQVKEPIRLSVLNSSNYLTFLERSFHTNFLPIRNSGVLFMNDYFNHELSYQLGLFRNSDKNTGDDKVSQNGFVTTARLTLMPIQNNEQFLHLGLAGSYRKYDSGVYNVLNKPESNLSNISYVAVTDLTNVIHVNIYNAEFAYSYHSLNFQGEYLLAHVNKTLNSNQFHTFYGQFGWFLTGEYKTIKDSYSGFNRVKSNQNIGVNTKGAWELALRYSYVDMTSADVFGGVQKDITLGLNWYLNPHTRFMFNQVYADVVSKGNVRVSQFRVQVDF